MKETFNYLSLSISEQAKEIARNIINKLSLPCCHGELAFWLHVDVPSDYVAIAVYVQGVLDTHDFIDEATVIEELITLLPHGFLTHYTRSL